MTDLVKVFGDDARSISSFASDDFPPPPPPPPQYHPQRPPGSKRSLAQTARERQEILKVDGKIPDVIHSLEYFGWGNQLIGTRQSANPFKHIPDAKSLRDGGNAEVEFQPPERPVIEIVTRVYSRKAPRNQPGRYRGRGGRINTSRRPVTAGFRSSDNTYQESSGTDGVDEEADERDIEEPVMSIWSEHLKNALMAVVAYYPHFQMSGRSLTIPSPYQILYHHREELAHYRDHQPEAHTAEYAATTAEHIDILLRFLETSNGTAVGKEEDRHTLDTPLATYEYFWLLLKPGTVVYTKRFDIWSPYVISSVSGGQYSHQAKDRYRLHGWLLEYNGAKVERFMEEFTVAPWLGEQAIHTLPVVPQGFWLEDLPAQKGLPMQQKMIQEGRLYWDLLKGPQYMEYSGHLVNSGAKNRHISGPTGFMTGRVIVDVPGFEKFLAQTQELDDMNPRRGIYNQPPPPQMPAVSKDHLPKTLPRCGCEVCAENRPLGNNDSPWVGFEHIDPTECSPPEDDLFYTLLSKTVPGFILGNRRWGHLSVESLKPVQTDKEAFKSLVIEDEIKFTVKALIGRFAASTENGGGISPWGNDFIKNKGEGRIFLLHGEPGVGKTCTAECIAELTGRPLLSLTSGDLGVHSFRVEQSLNYFLELGQRYGALVLLDEADVYLQQRHAHDMDRNALVSIFLRALEYYNGCIVISTNRVESFDSAFMSRIHVALHYKNLRDEDRERIWNNNFDRLDRDSKGKVYVSQTAREYVLQGSDVRGLQWNGREIRNAMQTALALAENEAQEEGLDKITIAEKHMRAVVKLSSSFKDYMTGLAGKDESDDEADDEYVDTDSD